MCYLHLFVVIMIGVLCVQLLKLYEEEMQDVVSLMEQTEMNHPKINDYLDGLKAVGQLYGKVGSRCSVM